MSETLTQGSTSYAFKKLRDEISVITDEVCEIHHIHKYSVRGKEPVCEACLRLASEERLQKRIQDNLAWEFKRKTSRVLTEDSIVDDEDILEAKFDNFKADTDEEVKALNFAKRTARFYAENGEANTVLTGKQGTGKSHLAMAIAKEVNRGERKAILFASFPRVIQLIQSSYNYPDSKYSFESMLDLLKAPDLLVLDDVGRERRPQRNEKSFAEDVLVSVLNARKNTIITTNYSSQELGQMYSRATASRIMKKIGKDHGFVFNNIKDKRVSNEESWW